MVPQISDLHGIMRIGNPEGSAPLIDTQYFIYFADKIKLDQYINLNQTEFTQWTWLTP